MTFELKVPSAGESITEVQIGAWLKKEGETARRDEVVVEIETDKSAIEIQAPVAGRVAKILKQAGEPARVGEVIGLMEQTAEAETGAAKSAATPTAATAAPPAAAAASGGFVMPAARRAMAEASVPAGSVGGTGPGGRVLKEDVQREIAARAAAPSAAPTAAAAPTPHSNGHGAREEDAVPMTMLRRRVAERLVEAQQNAALLTTFNEIDMTRILQLRRDLGDAFLQRYGVKLGFMSFFVKAVVDALRLVPQLNAEIRELAAADGRMLPHIVYKNFYDIGVAVGGGKGLVVPILRNAESMSLAQIEKQIGEFGARAKENKIALEELQGGTFTISNGGVYGSLLSTPIVNPPQSGILGLHAIQERPVVREGQIVIRSMMYVAMTYDHRIVDGREAVTFLKRIKDCVEDPARMLLEA